MFEKLLVDIFPRDQSQQIIIFVFFTVSLQKQLLYSVLINYKAAQFKTSGQENAVNQIQGFQTTEKMEKKQLAL